MDKNAYLVFTPLAWTKMWLLVDQFDSEVAWNGLCTRIDDNQYRVEDIVVHKQTVTGGTVRTDPAEYDEWLGQFDDETFEKIRMHGHSHYKIPSFPSGLDDELQKDISEQLVDDMFYIFIIVNRRRDMWVKIVDHKTNTTYYSNQVYWSVVGEGFDSVTFHEEAEALVAKHVYKKEDKKNGSGEVLRSVST